MEVTTVMRIIHDKQLCRDAADVDRWLYSFIIRRLSEAGRALLARLAHASYGGSSNPFEDPPVVFGATSIEDVTQIQLREVESTGTLSAGEPVLADLRKRSLVEKKCVCET